MNFLTDYLEQATSPREIAPLAQVIQSAGVTAQQRQGLWAAIGRSPGKLADRRSLVFRFPARAQFIKLPEMQGSLEKYRQKNHGCQGDPASTPPPRRSPPLRSSIRIGNPLSANKCSKLARSCATPPAGTLLSDADRSTPQWQQQVADYLNQLAGWTPDQENSEADYYHEKCAALTALIELVPPGPLNDKVLADYVDFIGNSNLYQQSPAEWFEEPERLLDRLLPNIPTHAKILDAYQRSGNPVLTLEVALERQLDR